ncbi:hypothetical protein N8631_02710 [Verrucomicrobiales bacterium]|nr:hypothetical protein [Verrucomicrobiales bacterium]
MGDGDGGQGLLIIAIIVITFINWLSQTLKEKAAKKNGQILDESHEKVNLVNEEAQQSQNREISESPAPQGPGAEMGIREFLAAMSGAESPEQPRPVPVITQDQQGQEQEPVQQIQSVTEVFDWEPEQEQKPEVSEPYDLETELPKPIRSVENVRKIHPIILKLRREGGAREAIIFSEILGKPKALRNQ